LLDDPVEPELEPTLVDESAEEDSPRAELDP
jgi:hypothetical protein